MPEYILLMHGDSTGRESESVWTAYVQRLIDLGCFRGGSSIGKGQSFRRTGNAGAVTAHLVGFIRIEVPDRASARALLDGNPTFEAGGTVEIRSLPTTS
jgi:hypothetical protein